MQTFLPYADLRGSCQVLDGPRLGKQRVEVYQVLRALTWPEYAWKQHPAVRMWRGFVPGLVAYGVEACDEWVRRGGADSLRPKLLEWSGGRVPRAPDLPPWFGARALHLSHRSALLRKDPAHYRPVFGDDPDDLPYLWPPDVWPRWPARRGDRPADLDTASQVLGLTPRGFQAEAVDAVRSSRDCLLVVRPGRGGSTTGLLAALATDGTSTLVVPPLGPKDTARPPRELLPARSPSTAPPVAATAREPSALDRELMAAEAQPSEVRIRVGEAAASGTDGLVVLDDARVVELAPGPRPPVLALLPQADPLERAVTVRRLGLRDPAWVGAGWDPARTWLAADEVSGITHARHTVHAAVRAHGPAVVLVGDRGRGERAVTALRHLGLRADLVAEPMRASRRDASTAGWRRRALDALVVSPPAVPELGRSVLQQLIGLDAPGTHADWFAAVDRWQPQRALLVTTPSAPVGDLVRRPGCRRAALLAPYGQPVAVPCGRCDRCCRADA